MVRPAAAARAGRDVAPSPNRSAAGGKSPKHSRYQASVKTEIPIRGRAIPAQLHVSHSDAAVIARST
jgi:hypothetical protein